MTSGGESNILVAFYQGTGRDHQNRKLDEILNWPDELLESCHDYIQTVFPLPEASRFSWAATLIDGDVFEAFRASPELRAALRRSFIRILSFYGLEIVTLSNGVDSTVQDGEVVIRRAANFPARSQGWVARVDHNHLRITRIIRSLRILGLEKEAEAFFEILTDIYVNSSDRCRPCKNSMMYWTRAAKRPLNFAPNVNNVSDPQSGEEFLRRYEMAKAAGETNGNSETSQLSDTTDDSDGGVKLPNNDEDFVSGKDGAESSSKNHRETSGDDDDSKTIKEWVKPDKGKSIQIESETTKEEEPISEHLPTYQDGSFTGDSSPSLKRKTQNKPEHSRKAMKSDEVDTLDN